MDWLTFGASIAATVGTLILGALGIRHQVRQERNKQIEAEHEIRRAERDHYIGVERQMWERTRDELDNMSGTIVALRREVAEERVARIEEGRAADERLTALMDRIKALEEENDILRQLLHDNGITLEE